MSSLASPPRFELIATLHGRRLLAGYRGAPAADLDALADALVRVSELIADCAAEIAEVDLNPLLCRPEGVLALDALVIKRQQ